MTSTTAADQARKAARAPRAASAALAAVLALSACDRKDPAPPQAGLPAVGVSLPVRRAVTEWDDFTGRFEAVESVEVRARVGGYLQQVHFKDGAIVQKGDPLFTIDPRPYEAAVMQAAGQLAEARSRVAVAERDVNRGQDLARTQAIAESVVDQRRGALQQAQGQVLQAEAALKRAQLDVEFSRVAAPVTGRIGRHLVSEGNLVQGGEGGATLLTTIVSLDPIQVYFDIDEATYLRNTRLSLAGQRPSSRDRPNPVRIQLPDEPAPSREGRMDFVDNRLDGGTGTLRGRALVPNPDFGLLPGQFARVQLVGASAADTLLLPDAAVGTDQSRRVVFVVKEDDTVEMRPVTLGRVVDGLRIVRDGLKPDERVVVDGLQRVKAGGKVKPEPREVAPPPAISSRTAQPAPSQPDAPQPGAKQAEAEGAR